MLYTSSTAPSAPKKAATETKVKPKMLTWMGSISAMVAPSAAPPDVPMMYGSAIGFRRSPWKTAPAVPSAPPTRMAVNTRGIRICQMMVSAEPPDAAPVSLEARARKTSPSGSDTEPMAVAKTTAASSRMPSAGRTIPLRLQFTRMLTTPRG